MFTQIKILLCSPPGSPFPDFYIKYLINNIDYIIGRDFYIDGSKIYSEWVWTYDIYDHMYENITDIINKKIIELRIDKNLLYGNCF